MNVLRKIEDKLAEVYKPAPAMPDHAKETTVKALPWVALVFGILQLLGALALWHLARAAATLTDYANSLSSYYNVQPVRLSGLDKTVIYLGLIVLVIDAALLLWAFSRLRSRAKLGWDLLFLSVLINVLYAVVALFINARGLGGFVIGVIESATALYFLYQIRSKYGKPVSVAAHAKTAK
jgi:hypothetical protein